MVPTRHGKLFAGQGLRATLVVGSPEAVGIDGDVDARVQVGTDEWRRDPKLALNRLEQLLVPDAFEVIDGFFVAGKLLALAEDGRAVLR